jgi:hypothetical protein
MAPDHLFLPACTYVQRGSKFCFVLVLGDTLIKLQWQDTKLQWQDTKMQWQDTKLQQQDNGAYCSLARQPCPAALPGSLARQPCPEALPGSLARQPCPAALHRQPCPAALQKYYSLNNRP